MQKKAARKVINTSHSQNKLRLRGIESKDKDVRMLLALGVCNGMRVAWELPDVDCN
jgi:hypothetical protein